MRQVIAALACVLILSVGNVTAAAKITDAQLGKIFTDIAQVDSAGELYLDAAAFQDRFNWLIGPIIQDGMRIDDASAMEYFFTIKGFDVAEAAGGKIYSNVFGYTGVAFAGLSAADDDDFTVMSLYYVTPENTDEAVFTSWLVKAFVGSITPDVDSRALMIELTADGSSGNAVKDGVKFSIAADGNLNVLTARKAD